jgi:hypothetical protein
MATERVTAPVYKTERGWPTLLLLFLSVNLDKMTIIALSLLPLALPLLTSALENGLARTPPMGWNSWVNTFETLSF